MTCPSHRILPAFAPSGCLVRRTAQQARGLSFSSTIHARTQRQRWSGVCVAQTRPKRLHPQLEWSKTHVHRGPLGESMCYTVSPKSIRLAEYFVEKGELWSQ